MDSASTRSRNRRIEVRATAEDRQLIDRAVIASGTDLTGFVITHLRLAAQQVLADREDFRLAGKARTGRAQNVQGSLALFPKQDAQPTSFNGAG